MPPAHALIAIRVVACALLFIHGTTRALTGGVAGFGQFLSESHLPLGLAIAWCITILEIAGTLVLASGHLIRPLALYFAVELTTGIIMVHSKVGWFVVGGGTGGMEYSVLLVSVFLAVAWGSPRPGSTRS